MEFQAKRWKSISENRTAQRSTVERFRLFLKRGKSSFPKGLAAIWGLVVSKQ